MKIRFITCCTRFSPCCASFFFFYFHVNLKFFFHLIRSCSDVIHLFSHIVHVLFFFSLPLTVLFISPTLWIHVCTTWWNWESFTSAPVPASVIYTITRRTWINRGSRVKCLWFSCKRFITVFIVCSEHNDWSQRH